MSQSQRNAASHRDKRLTHYPQMGTVGKRGSALAFTNVNTLAMSNLSKSRLHLFTRGSRWHRSGYSGVNALM